MSLLSTSHWTLSLSTWSTTSSLDDGSPAPSPIVPSLKLSPPRWPACWPTFVRWGEVDSCLSPAVVDPQRGSHNHKNQIPVVNSSCTTISCTAGLVHSSWSPFSSTAGLSRRTARTPCPWSLPLETCSHSWCTPGFPQPHHWWLHGRAGPEQPANILRWQAGWADVGLYPPQKGFFHSCQLLPPPSAAGWLGQPSSPSLETFKTRLDRALSNLI